MTTRPEKLADAYACGVGRNDGNGVSSYPDTFEVKAYLAGYKQCNDDAAEIALSLESVELRLLLGGYDERDLCAMIQTLRQMPDQIRELLTKESEVGKK